MPAALDALGRPRVVVLTNLFRDQLDRYGEVDRLAAGWLEALRPLGRRPCSSPTPTTRSSPGWPSESGCLTLFFGVDVRDGRAEREVSDVTICPRCSTMLEYTSRWLSQLGDYRCPSCGFARPPRDFEARALRTVDGHAEAQLAGRAAGELRLRVPGLYNVYNALAGARAHPAARPGRAAALDLLCAYQPVFGRWSRVRARGVTIQVNLVKNPAGMNQTLRALGECPGAKALVFVLNDNIADGRDISWIWDADMEELLPAADLVVTTGTRQHEMALRLSYAGVPDERLETVASLAEALRLAGSRGATDACTCCPPTPPSRRSARPLAGWETMRQ